MRRSRPSLLALFLCLSVVALAPVRAQEDDSGRIERRVQRYVERMEAPGANLWDEALKLEELGPDAAEPIKKAMEGKGERTRLGCAKALCRLGARETGLDSLIGLVKEARDVEVQILAADLLGIEGDLSLEEDLEGLLDNALEPRLKVALAKSLYRASRNVRGTRELRALLESESVELRYEAALALAEVGNIEDAKVVLNDLKKEPTPRGRLARSYIDRLQERERYEKMIFSGVTKDEEKEPAFLRELAELIQKLHVYGDKHTEEDLLVAAAKGMVQSMDLHSSYWTKKEWEEFLERLKQDYAGIGVYVGLRDGYFTVISPIYSGPGYEAGLRSGDRILEVEGWSTVGQPVEDIIKKIKGTPGTKVSLKCYRAGWNEARTFVVERRRIEVPSVYHKMLPGKIGYVEMIQFGKETAAELGRALEDLEAKGMESLVLDLRDNGGGYLEAAVSVADFFLDEGKLVVYSEGRNKTIAPRQQLLTTGKGQRANYPLVILVNGGSASASEIVAGALSEHKRATLVGERTFGKGTVQQVLELKSRPDDRLRLTIAKYYLPSGRSVDREVGGDGKVRTEGGVLPDVEVLLPESTSWKNEALQQLLERNAFQDYLDRHYAANQEILRQLAENDGRDPARYPGFEEWFAGLGTRAAKEDVRAWLRSRIRARVSDDVGAKLVGDYVDDPQLQRGIVVALEKLGRSAESIEEYRMFANAAGGGEGPK
ncbi:MAG: PDZ domain-containing protein [Planctomycetes bacterium]|nr:PDZ domain-containing protein [Planctomycetota bacterium]